MAGNVFIFPGQGSQAVGMGKDIAEASPAAMNIYRRADEVLGFELSKVCFEGPESELMRTELQQPAILVTSVAIWAAVVERTGGAEIRPEATAGLSLGEYTALHVAGSLSFEDAVTLVRRRGELMRDAAAEIPGAMVSIIGGDEPQVTALCSEVAHGDVLAPANFNCRGQIVISGTVAACQRAVEAAGKHGVRAIMLKVAGAFHSPLVASAADKLAEVLADTTIATPRCPVIANVDARAHDTPDTIRDGLCRQMTNAVRWQDSIEMLIAGGCDRFVEIGPGRVLTGLMRKIDRAAEAINISAAAHLDLDLRSTTAA